MFLATIAIALDLAMVACRGLGRLNGVKIGSYRLGVTDGDMRVSENMAGLSGALTQEEPLRVDSKIEITKRTIRLKHRYALGQISRAVYRKGFCPGAIVGNELQGYSCQNGKEMWFRSG